MKITTSILLLALPALLFWSSCNSKSQHLNGFTSKIGRASMLEKYPKSPGEEILRQPYGSKLYSELEARYKESLAALQIETDRDGAKLVVVILTPDVGKSLNLTNTYSTPFIVQSCNLLGIDCLDLSAVLGGEDLSAMTQGPSAGNWSKAGSAFIADQLSYLVLGYDCFKNTKPFPAGQKPATFGDLKPHMDEVLEGEKNVSLHFTTNSQGLRIDHDVTFPKKKQTILFMGDAAILCPYLDDKLTPTALLQKKYPGKEIINAAYLHYTIEDYLSLYVEKTRYTEPDIVVVCTDGEDIFDYYFTDRNRYSRIVRVYRPTDAEKQFYNQLNNPQN